MVSLTPEPQTQSSNTVSGEKKFTLLAEAPKADSVKIPQLGREAMSKMTFSTFFETTMNYWKKRLSFWKEVDTCLIGVNWSQHLVAIGGTALYDTQP